MTSSLDVSTRQIEKAADALKILRPVYEPLLTFYGQVFIAQEKSKAHIDLEPITLSADTVALLQKESMPLVDITEFNVDAAAGKTLLKEICHIIEASNPEMAMAAKTIREALGSDIIPGALFTALLGSDDAYFEETAGQASIDKQALAFVAYNSAKPSLMLCAEQLAGYLGDSENRLPGYCPVCGNAPGISILDNDGARFLYCSFCWHQWAITRGRCPFCGNQDHSTHHYFYSEAEKSYRVDVCDHCKKYIKTVDLRKTQHPVYAPLELVSSLHLDMRAREAGYESSVALQLP